MSIFSGFKKAIVFAPHTDDGEFGCGATIHRMIREGVEVFYVAFSACQQSVLPQFPSDILITEVKAATKVLGVKPENVILMDFEVRKFNYNRQEILDEILKIKSSISPDVVFVPCEHDIHQDHATIANEVVRAFKFSTILSYELPWNNFTFTTACFVEVGDEDILAKCDALAQYKSQLHRPYANAEFVKSLARVRGVQSNHTYAEAFEIKRLIAAI
jgi:LmbE family N-acetylglucosaminyl deacetylase